MKIQLTDGSIPLDRLTNLLNKIFEVSSPSEPFEVTLDKIRVKDTSISTLMNSRIIPIDIENLPEEDDAPVMVETERFANNLNLIVEA